MIYDIAIIGAGPSGIMAAITSARAGRSVLLIDKNPAVGRKILATGNGRCNITNRFAKADNYHGASKEFVEGILNKFDQHQTMKFFNDLGLILKEEDRGRMFPRSNQAQSVVDILANELNDLKVDIKLNTEIKSIVKKDDWILSAQDTKVYTAKKLILTTGGKAAHQFGSSGDGLFWSQKIGHKIEQTFPALVPAEVSELDYAKDLQGIKFEAKASFYVDGKMISERTGDLIVTHYGLSGPAIMSQTRNIAPYLDKKVTIRIDFIIDKTEQELNKTLKELFDARGAKLAKNALVGLMPLNLIPVILKQSNVDTEIKCANISRLQRQEIIKNLKSFSFTVTRLRSFKEAQVTRGGISEADVEETLQSKKTKDLYFAGEILDVDGDSGGFNLQWAWSSGHLAGESASK